VSDSDTQVATKWVVASGVLVVAYAVAIALWAVSASTDHVPVGRIDGAMVSQPVECNSILDAQARDTDLPLPDPADTFAAELASASSPTELGYTRPPCESPRRDGRVVLGINVVLILLATAAWTGWVVFRRRSVAPRLPASATT
jgi:hypothetical protein